MIQIVWEFRVAEENQPEFERAYDSQGLWATLFQLGEGYGGTTLLRDNAQRGRYFTIDHWSSYADFDRFKNQFAENYAATDQKCEALTESERVIGVFETVEAVSTSASK